MRRSESMYREPYGRGQQYGEGRYGQGEYGSADYESGAYRGGYGGEYGGASYGRDYSGTDEEPGRGYSSVAAGYEPGRYGQGDYDDIYGAYPGRGAYGRTNPEYGALGYRDYGEFWHNPDQDAYSRYEDAGERGVRERSTSSYYGSRGVFGERESGEPYPWPGGYQQHRTRLSRGPKGYRRSDERIREVISERLWHANDVIDASEVTVDVQGGEVTLAGTVPERWMRYAIEDMADECPDVQDIANHIRVARQQSEVSRGV